MIVFSKADMDSQEGMERAFLAYVRQVEQDHDGSFNGLLHSQVLECDFAHMRVRMGVQTLPWMANPNGVLHGGVTASVMDLVMGLLSRYFSGGGLTPTVNLNVSYLRPIPLGQLLVAQAQVAQNGFHMCSVTGSAWMESAPSKLVATATGIYYVNRSSR